MGQFSSRWFLVLVFLVVTGCQQNPGNMSQADVEKLLNEKFQFKTMTITPNPSGGGYTGNGLATDGSKYKITVVQDSQARKLSYSAVNESDSTEEISGSLELK